MKPHPADPYYEQFRTALDCRAVADQARTGLSLNLILFRAGYDAAMAHNKPGRHLPSLDEVRAYCKERGGRVDPEKWFDHYSSNGWKVGKNPMKDWRAAVRTWERSEFNQPARAQQQSFREIPACN